MELSELGRHWDNFGRQDPLWAILTREDARGGRWNEEAFFATGRLEVASLIQHLDELGLPLARRRALDFGCGVGRLTQALGRYFEECEGVDIAPSMVALAQGYNRHGPRCRYFVNASTDLGRFEDERFDLVYSNLVLQHMRPEYAQRYVEEFVRVMSPEGIAVFQIPTGQAERQAPPPSPPASEALPDTPFAARLVVNASSLDSPPARRGADATRIPVTVRHPDRWVAALRRCATWWARRRADAVPSSAGEPQSPPRMEMYAVPVETVLEWVAGAGAHLIDLQIVAAAGPWAGLFYYVTKSTRHGAVDHQRVMTSLLASILPPVAFQAGIEVAAPPRVADRGAQLCLHVTIKNLSPTTWPGVERLGGRHEINVGNRWRDDQGQLVVADDGRAALRHDLPPGEETTLVLAVNAPAKSGPHILELDLVQEHVAWFNASGTTRFPVLVR